jgi:hypothetical protein
MSVLLKLIEEPERNRAKASNIPCTQFRRTCVEEGIYSPVALKTGAQ